MKRLRILNSALSRIGNRERIVTSSLSRRIDILSYSRKILGSFFEWLADRLLKIDEKWDRDYSYLKDGGFVTNPATIPAYGIDSVGRLFDPIEITIESGIVKAKIGRVEVIINEIDVSSFNDDEKKLFYNYPCVVIIRFEETRSLGSFRESAAGGVATSGKGTGHTLFVKFSTRKDKIGYIKKQIPNVYRRLLELFVHENTHLQQNILAGISKDDDVNFVPLINKDQLYKQMPDTESVEEFNFNQEAHNAETIKELSSYHTNKLKKQEEIIEKNKNDNNFNEKNKNAFVEYLSTPIEIEAFIRGLRSTGSFDGKRHGGKSFASMFRGFINRYNFTYEQKSDLWSRYKEVYKSLNYPEKYLGTDEEAISV